MATLKIDTGLVVLDVEDESGNIKGKFSFNPEDLSLAKGLVELQKDFEEKKKEFDARIEKVTDAVEGISITIEIADYMCKGLDSLFGAGTSELLFGNARTVSMFESFFNGVTPYFKKASEKRMRKYLNQ